MRDLFIVSGLCLFFVLPLQATDSDVSIKPFLKVQVWNAFKSDDASAYIRRGRFGLSAKVDNRWLASTCFEFDKLGKDDWAYPEGISSNVNVRLWDFFLSWKPLNDKDLLVVTTGYTLPQLSREVMTKPWFIPSLEKAKSSSVLRDFVIGNKSGISPMINAGGLIAKEQLYVEYNLSWIQAGAHYANANSKANLLAGRLNLGLGSKEKYRYKKLAIMPADSKSIVLGLNGSYQGKTLDFDLNSSYGFDYAGQLKGVKLSGEYMHLHRSLNQAMLNGSTGFFRISYAKEFKGYKSIEPSITCSASKFSENEFDFTSDLASSVDAGIDYYCNNRMVKISFHYTLAAVHSRHKIKTTDYSTELVVLTLQLIIK